jgi:hypothetical protein
MKKKFQIDNDMPTVTEKLVAVSQELADEFETLVRGILGRLVANGLNLNYLTSMLSNNVVLINGVHRGAKPLNGKETYVFQLLTLNARRKPVKLHAQILINVDEKKIWHVTDNTTALPDPWSEDLTEEQKKSITTLCQNDPEYFFNEVARITAGQDSLQPPDTKPTVH